LIFGLYVIYLQPGTEMFMFLNKQTKCLLN